MCFIQSQVASRMPNGEAMTIRLVLPRAGVSVCLRVSERGDCVGRGAAAGVRALRMNVSLMPVHGTTRANQN